MKKFLIPTLAAIIGCSLQAMAASPLTGPILNPANNHYYYLLSSDNWTGSQSQALSLGGNLVTINDAAENAWVASTFLNYGGITRDLWTGLNDAATEGTFVWANGEAFSYSNWEPGQPDNGFGGGENYVHMYGGGTYHEASGWQAGGWNDFQDLSLYGTFDPANGIRNIFGVVEVVPEPATSALLLAAGSLALWLRKHGKI